MTGVLKHGIMGNRCELARHVGVLRCISAAADATLMRFAARRWQHQAGTGSEIPGGIAPPRKDPECGTAGKKAARWIKESRQALVLPLCVGTPKRLPA